MTSKQRIAILATWWPAACSVQGWRISDRPRRLDIISEAVGRQITTLNDLNNSDDIDKVKAHLGALAEDIDGAVELTPSGADYGYRRRLFWLIRKHGRNLGGDLYILGLARDKFHLVTGLSCLEDLQTEQLHQLMMTLNARQFAQRRASKNASLTREEQFPDDCTHVYAGHENDDNQPF